MTEEINDQGRIGKVIVLAAADVDGKFKADLAVFAETMAGIHVLIDTLERKNNYQKNKGTPGLIYVTRLCPYIVRNQQSTTGTDVLSILPT